MTDTMQTPAAIEPTREVKGLQHSLRVLEMTAADINDAMDVAPERQSIVERAIETLSADPALQDLDHDYIEEYEERLRHFFMWHEETKDRRRKLQDAIWDLAKEHAEQAGNGSIGGLDDFDPSDERRHSEDVQGEVWSRFNDVVWPADSEHPLQDGSWAPGIVEKLHALDARRSA